MAAAEPENDFMCLFKFMFFYPFWAKIFSILAVNFEFGSSTNFLVLSPGDQSPLAYSLVSMS